MLIKREKIKRQTIEQRRLQRGQSAVENNQSDAPEPPLNQIGFCPKKTLTTDSFVLDHSSAILVAGLTCLLHTVIFNRRSGAMVGKLIAQRLGFLYT